jgi:predicted metal-dependent HD superfamily phosphohydrolase
MTKHDFLYSHWQQMVGDCNPAIADFLFDQLCQRYAEPHRQYHNWAHIGAVWQHLEPHFGTLHYPLAVQFAVFYHDAIYNTQQQDNEEQSAYLAQNDLAIMGYDAQLQQRVGALIQATKTHIAPPNDHDMRYFLDADLAILGSNDAVYKQYTQAIRAEYAWVQDDLYRNGRKAVLMQLANKKPLYYTYAFEQLYQTKAMANLQAEIAQLSY